RVEVGLEQGELGKLLRREFQESQPVWVFNAAVPAGDPVTMEYVLGQVIQRGARPDWAIVEVSPETLNEYNEWLGIHVRRQLRWDHVPSYLVETCWSGQGLRLFSARFFALFLHRQQLL